MPSTTTPFSKDSSVRQRNIDAKDTKPEVPRTADDNKKILGKALVNQLPPWVPDPVKNALKNIWPAIIFLGKLIDIASPYVALAWYAL